MKLNSLNRPYGNSLNWTSYENEKGGGPGRPASLFSPLGEPGQSDGGRLAGRVLACLYNPGIQKKVPAKAKKMNRITMEIRRPLSGATPHAKTLTPKPR
jgi:hypothetical protein